MPEVRTPAASPDARLWAKALIDPDFRRAWFQRFGALEAFFDGDTHDFVVRWGAKATAVLGKGS